MIKRLESILIGSENAEALANFYKEKVGLNMTNEMEMGDKPDKGFEFTVSGCKINIFDNSEVTGKNMQPRRLIFNLEVDNIETEVKRLDEAGVKKIQDTFHIQTYGMVATFEDIDGNYFQLIQIKED